MLGKRNIVAKASVSSIAMYGTKDAWRHTAGGL